MTEDCWDRSWKEDYWDHSGVEQTMVQEEYINDDGHSNETFEFDDNAQSDDWWDELQRLKWEYGRLGRGTLEAAIADREEWVRNAKTFVDTHGSARVPHDFRGRLVETYHWLQEARAEAATQREAGTGEVAPAA